VPSASSLRSQLTSLSRGPEGIASPATRPCAATNWRIIAGRGVRELRFVRPVRPADIVTGFLVIENIRAARGTGDVITLKGTLVNQTRDTVFTMRTGIEVHHRPSCDAHCDVLSKSGNCHDPSNAGASGP